MATKKTSSKTSSNACRATDYANKVVAGKIVAGPHVRAACQRHLNDLSDGADRGLFFDYAAADKAYRFFETQLKLNGGQYEGKPFKLHCSQAFILGSLFGWFKTEKKDTTRRFRRAFIEQGKGNGKSPFAAGIGLYGLIADGENRAEVYAAAAKREQAMVLFRDAIAMVHQSTSLSRWCEVSGGNHQPNIAFLRRASFFRPISSEKSQSGPRPSMALCDEIHEHRSRDTIDMLERGFKFRKNPLLLMITNSGFDKSTVCWEEHEHAVKVAHGDKQDDSTFSYVCALDEKDDPLTDPACWIKANPLLGVTISESYLKTVVSQARNMPGKRNGILRLHFCVWTDAESACISRELWTAAEKTLRLEDYYGRRCTAGLDLSFTQDLTALALVFENEDEATYDCFVEFWTPADTLAERTARTNVPYDVWVDLGLIHATPGKVIKTEHIGSRIAEIMDDFELVGIAYDRYRHKELDEDLQDLGIDVPMIEHPQGFRRVASSDLWMPSSIEAFENGLLEGTLNICQNDVLRWNAACTVAREDPAGTANHIYDKRKSTGKIDGIVAFVMALGLASVKVEANSMDDFFANPVVV